MICFLCSFYAEAEEIISYYNLKKKFSPSSFQIFSKDDIKLIVSGVGKINAACAVGYIADSMGKCQNNIFINVGICGSKNRNIGEAVLVNKISDEDTLRESYPDIILKHNFEEGSLETFSSPVWDDSVIDICDMEGSAFFESASRFLEKHQIALIKIVSDNLDEIDMNSEYVKNLIKNNIDKINSYVEEYKKVFCGQKFLSDLCEKNMEKIINNLRCTESQDIQLKRAVTAYKIRNNKEFDFSGFLNTEVKVKSEGKKHFSKLMDTMWER
ncbi:MULTISPECIES: hypothetical protein [Clostridium]|uniref:5'-methylthioadenosine/S-adenosylhomocysteine nucleosidase family protein n=1 Tax=Clostridium TaxID=1485 RepID=UPI00082626D6|nr:MULTISPECIES: hypothetical protein [Clostridium]PJI09123.1 hypothetical protein CUB90_15130 [Clostridium sp. CT7]